MPKKKTEKIAIQIRVPADLETAIDSAAMYCAGGNRNSYICQLIIKDLNDNLDTYKNSEKTLGEIKI